VGGAELKKALVGDSVATPLHILKRDLTMDRSTRPGNRLKEIDFIDLF